MLGKTFRHKKCMSLLITACPWFKGILEEIDWLMTMQWFPKLTELTILILKIPLFACSHVRPYSSGKWNIAKVIRKVYTDQNHSLECVNTKTNLPKYADANYRSHEWQTKRNRHYKEREIWNHFCKLPGMLRTIDCTLSIVYLGYGNGIFGRLNLPCGRIKISTFWKIRFHFCDNFFSMVYVQCITHHQNQMYVISVHMYHGQYV